MNKKNLICLAFTLTLLIPSVVLAYTYTTSITAIESDGNSYTQLPVIATVNNQYLADNGYISSTGLDTKVLRGATELPHMLANDKTLFCSAMSANEQSNFNYTFGNTALESFPIIVGHGGYVTVSDDGSIELSNTFAIELKGYVDTSSGSDKNLIYKQDAFRVYVNASYSVRAAILGTGDSESLAVTATPVSSGVHIVKVTADATNFKIFIDGNEKGTIALGANSVPDNGNPWKIMQNNVMPYMEYLKIEV